MIETDFASPSFRLAPIAADTGPFPLRPFLSTWWDSRSKTTDRLLVAATDHALIPAMMRSGTMSFVGHGDVTDYHSPLGTDLTGAIGELAEAVPTGTHFRFDSLPEEAAAPLHAALAPVADVAEPVQHEVAAVLPLPTDFDEYLMAIGKKERHETRRKLRRFAAEIGEPELQRRHGDAAVSAFAAMHRKADGDKGGFMDAQMEHLFHVLHEHAGACIDVLVGSADVPVAAAFGFEDEQGYYLYNSAYDPGARHASPGVVLVSMLIERTIDSGRTVFDFLKGDETYKFRLGAQPRPLFELKGRFRGSL